MLRKIDPNVRVVIVSGHASERDVEHLRAEGVRGYLAKPFDAHQLLEAVGKALEADA
jgi:DNA-binding NarL/FixJ family response regulator